MLWKTEKRKITDLKPAPYNPRSWTDEATHSLKRSIDKFDVADPIIINTNNTVIGGHFRLKILKEKGVSDVDVRVPERQLTDEEERELNLRLNKNLGGWDFSALANFDQNMLLDVGFDSKELDRIFQVEPDEKDDDVPEAPEEPKTRPGDIYLLGRHRVMCGDSTKIDDVERLMDGKKANCLFTDPPYLMDFTGNVHSDGSKSHNASFGRIKNDKMGDEEAIKFLSDIITNARMFTLGAYYICWYRLGLNKIFNALDNQKIDYKALIIWDKGNHTLSNSDYMSRYEPIIYGWFDRHDFYGGSQYDLWRIDRTQKNTLHPTMKPVELITTALIHSTQHNGIILDLFLGSGSTLIACEKTNRICYGMEIDPKYCDVIVKRWEDYTGQQAERLNSLNV